jgi:hypothetical protein
MEPTQAEPTQAEQTQADQAQADQAQAEPTQAEQALKLPYRTVLNDKFNKLYADGIKKTFILLPLNLQIEFEKFTENLMQEEYIARGLLLDAINCFYRHFYALCDASYMWTKFSDNAWNYRPYQPAF